MNDRPTNPIITLTLIRLKEFIRRPEALFWVYFFPVLMVVVLGTAFRNKPADKIFVDVLSNEFAAEVVAILNIKTDDGANNDFETRIVDATTARDRLRSSKSNLLVVAKDKSLDLLEYQFDPQRPGSKNAKLLVDNRLQTSAGRMNPIQTRDVVFEEPGGRYVDFLVPGLLAMGLMGGGLWGVGYAIVDMRIRKLLKRYMATPMRRSHFLIAMMASRLVYMWPQVIVLLLFSYFAFGVTSFGSWFSVAFVVFIGAIEFAAIGLLVAARTRTLEAASGLMNLAMLPMWTLSGIFFSYENFPEILHPIIKWLPLTPVIDALRAIMMDGKTLASQWPELGIITLWCIVPFAIALWIFRWSD
jgi:ABC-type multidrug transport system permease subunit